MCNRDSIENLIKSALKEDIGHGDVTTSAIVEKDKQGQAQIIAKQPGILAGIDCAIDTFILLDPDIHCTTDFKNGDTININYMIAQIEGRISSILKSERTALNILAHLSGISTLTAKYVEQVKGTHAKVTDTRKTTPLWREMEKEAVRHGGGVNHRKGLYDMVLIKENHIQAAGSIQKAVERSKKYLSESNLKCKIEVETTNLEQVREALSCSVDQIMLDNMGLTEIKEAVNIIAGRAIVEASGGVSLENIKSIAETGVDIISIGALTHSAPAFDFSLLIKGE
jgi:nicotinate-nucleotide pyrophosphorylase (carboxylating)